MSHDPIQPTDAPDLTRLSDDELVRRYRERDDLANALYLRWLVASEFNHQSDKLLVTSRPVRNEVERCRAELVRRGARLALSFEAR